MLTDAATAGVTEGVLHPRLAVQVWELDFYDGISYFTRGAPTLSVLGYALLLQWQRGVCRHARVPAVRPPDEPGEGSGQESRARHPRREPVRHGSHRRGQPRADC